MAAPRHTGQRLGEIFAVMVEAAAQSGQAQKLGLAKGALLRVTVSGRRISLLIARQGVAVNADDLAVVAGQCGIPRTARRRPATGQHRQEIGGKQYYAIEFSWSLW